MCIFNFTFYVSKLQQFIQQKMEQLVKPAVEFKVAVSEMDQADQPSCQTLYKIQINNLDFAEKEEKVHCRQSCVSQVNDLMIIKKITSNTQIKQEKCHKSVRLVLTGDQDEQKYKAHQNITTKKSQKSLRSIKLNKTQKKIQSIEDKLKSSHYKNYIINMKENGDCLVTMESGQKMLIRHASEIEQKHEVPPGWERQNRIGCCCFSMSKETFCFSCCMISSLCICLQSNNVCCFCQDMDCSYFCVADCCRDCCFQKTYGDCFLECCKSLPCCTIYDCLVHGKQINCNCLTTLKKVILVSCIYCGKCFCAAAICMCICFR